MYKWKSHGLAKMYRQKVLGLLESCYHHAGKLDDKGSGKIGEMSGMQSVKKEENTEEMKESRDRRWKEEKLYKPRANDHYISSRHTFNTFIRVAKYRPTQHIGNS